MPRVYLQVWVLNQQPPGYSLPVWSNSRTSCSVHWPPPSWQSDKEVSGPMRGWRFNSQLTYQQPGVWSNKLNKTVSESVTSTDSLGFHALLSHEQTICIHSYLMHSMWWCKPGDVTLGWKFNKKRDFHNLRQKKEKVTTFVLNANITTHNPVLLKSRDQQICQVSDRWQTVCRSVSQTLWTGLVWSLCGSVSGNIIHDTTNVSKWKWTALNWAVSSSHGDQPDRQRRSVTSCAAGSSAAVWTLNNRARCLGWTLRSLAVNSQSDFSTSFFHFLPMWFCCMNSSSGSDRTCWHWSEAGR